jgi:mono/diheme cytochrome c family protein
MRVLPFQKPRSVLKFASLAGILLLVACTDPAMPAPTPTLDPASDAGKGARLFAANCATCHALAEDTLIVGPSLAHIATRAASRVAGLSAEDYIHDSILYPNDYVVEGFKAGAMQQDFGTRLTSEEATQLVAFLMTQK